MSTNVQLKDCAAVVKALRQRYAAPAWAVLEQVANGTGGRADRWADAVAMSLWPSRGLELHGFEVKVYRNDVLRELKKPDKAEAVASYCDFWWMAVGSAEIAKPDEIPPAWGLLVPGKGATLRVAKEPQRLSPKPTDRAFLAALLRRAAECYDPAAVEARIRREFREEIRADVEKSVADNHGYDLLTLQQDLDVANRKIEELRESVRLLSTWTFDAATLNKAVRILQFLDGWGGIPTLDRVTNTLEGNVSSLVATLRDVRGLVDQMREGKNSNDAERLQSHEDRRDQ